MNSFGYVAYSRISMSLLLLPLLSIVTTEMSFRLLVMMSSTNVLSTSKLIVILASIISSRFSLNGLYFLSRSICRHLYQVSSYRTFCDPLFPNLIYSLIILEFERDCWCISLSFRPTLAYLSFTHIICTIPYFLHFIGGFSRFYIIFLTIINVITKT